MGIRGFSEFVNDNNIAKSHKLHNTRVVIDGSNLIFYLYTKYNINSKFGGDYSEFANRIRNYFSNYQKCSIEPLVMFDGGFDKSDNLRTPGVSLKYQRMHQKHEKKHDRRLKNISNIIERNEEKNEVCTFPINAYEVFKEVLSEMGVQFAQCDYEGDNQMAAMANKLWCPLISDDSDYYLFELKYGFIKCADIEHSIKRYRNKTAKYKYLKCRLYLIKNLLKLFKLSIGKLHLFAALCENRYIHLIDFKQFYAEIVVENCQIPNFDSIYKNYDVHIHTIFRFLLKWLSGLELENAREIVLNKISFKYREKAKYLLRSMIEDYRLDSNYLKQILSTGLKDTNDVIVQSTRLIAPCGSRLPKQFVSDFHKGKLPSFLFNIISLHRNFLAPQIEVFSSQSSYKCSQYIRQVMYSILLQHDDQNTEEHERTCLGGVVEYDRKSCTIFPKNSNELKEEVTVEYITNLRTGEKIPKLTEIYDMDQNSLREFVANVMGLKMSFFEGIPSNLQLLFGCIQFWLLSCLASPRKEFLSALVLCIMYHQVQELGKKDSESEFSKGLHPFLQNVPIGSTKKVIKKFQKYFVKPQWNETNPIDFSIVHSYSQFQTCFLDFNSLNLLTNLPFEGPKLHKTTDGTVLYNLTKALIANHDHQNMETFIKNIFDNEPSMMRLYRYLNNKIFERIPIITILKKIFIKS